MTTATEMDFATDVASAVACMRRGGIVLYPTDTVWGIGCDASNADAVARVFALKRRAESKAMISLVDSRDMLARYAGEESALRAETLGRSEPGRPVTVVVPGVGGLAPALSAPDGSAAFRITAELYSAALCHELGGAVVSTSANVSGQPPAALFAEISREIVDGVDYVASYRRNDLRRSNPSKVVKLDADGSLTVIRP